MSFTATYRGDMSSNSRSSDRSKAQAWNAEVPYNALPGLPPPFDLETKQVLKSCVTARAALGELKQAVRLIPNPDMLINTLPILEAQASSEIENVVTTSDRLFRHLSAEKTGDPATREALRYRDALLNGFEMLRTVPLSTRLAEEVCSRIKDVEMEVRRVPGTALVDSSGRVVYTPPEGESRLRDLMSNWERFLHEERGLDPLVRMAAAHYQFEAIHPFTDGNGRTGRVLNNLALVAEELLPSPVLYLSRYITAHKRDYHRLLLEVTSNGAWEQWLRFMLDAVEQTSRWTTKKVEAIRALAEHTAEYAHSQLPAIYSLELVDVLFEQPYCRIADVVAAGIVERQAASRYLKALTDIAVLREESLGREKLFVHDKLLAMLGSENHSWEPYE
jgi:Fic family protein